MTEHHPIDPKKLAFMSKVVRAALRIRKARYQRLGRSVASAYARPNKDELKQVARDMAAHGNGSLESMDIAEAWITERERSYDAQLEQLAIAQHAARIAGNHARA